MPEEQVIDKPIRELGKPEIFTPGNAFSGNSWSTEPIKPVEQITPVKEPAKTEPAASVVIPDEEKLGELEHLHKQTGFKTWEEINSLKAEAEQLRTKAQTPAERKFANEESRRLAEAWEAGETDKVFDYLNTQRQLKKAADLPAGDAIKLHLQQTNPHYKPEDIDDIFDERYSVPRKPVKDATELDEDFQTRTDEYNQRVAKVNRAIERDGFSAKQELAKRITELVPPEIPKKEATSQGSTQEELQSRLQFVDSYAKSIPTGLQKFEGYSTVFKDDTVEIPISYTITEDEKKEMQAELESFAKLNLDANALFESDWVNKDGSINVQRMAEDRYLLKNRDKIFRKIANESATQRLNHQRKINSNIKVDGKGAPVVTGEKNDNEKMLDHFWKNG